MRENCTSGSGQGAPGNRRSYCERRVRDSSNEMLNCSVSFLGIGRLCCYGTEADRIRVATNFSRRL